MQAGIPVLARINENTDLEKIIMFNKVGKAYTKSNVMDFNKIAKELLIEESNKKMSYNCENLYRKTYTSQRAANQILESLKNN